MNAKVMRQEIVSNAGKQESAQFDNTSNNGYIAAIDTIALHYSVYACAWVLP